MKTNLKAFLGLSAVSVLTLLFVSLQSYTHDISNLYDSTWYFMCGKAWMNGMIPYVDFADSKGPLLWLLFGGSYLFSPHTFLGVFWLTCLSYTFACFFAYKLAGLYLRDSRKSFLVAACMLVLFLNKMMRNDIHTEDLTLCFIMLSLYTTCRMFYFKGSANVAGFLTGLGLAATLLIKFTGAAMIGVFALSVCYALLRRRKPLWLPFGSFVLGASLLLLPFLAYFVSQGTLGIFIDEYFVKTLITTRNGNPVENALTLLKSPANIFVLLTTLPGLFLIAYRHRSERFFPLVAFAIIYLMTLPNAWLNYLMCVVPFSIFTLIVLADGCLHRHRPLWTDFALVFLSMVASISSTLYLHNYRHPDVGDFFTQDNSLRRQFYFYEYLINEVPCPRIVYGPAVPPVNGICSDALPGCKYFARQYGATDAMIEDQYEAVRKRKADFALIAIEDKEFAAVAEKAGYRRYYRKNKTSDFCLYSRRQLKLPPDSFHVSNMDVLLKRELFPSRR